MKQQPLTKDEFADKVDSDKCGAIDFLVVELYGLRLDFAEVSVDYFKTGGQYGKGDANFDAKGRKLALEWDFEILSGALSGLQSSLKHERELSRQ